MDIAKLIDAISRLAWPVLAALVLWRLLPLIREIARSRGFTVKVGEMELSVQEASEQLRSQIEDLQRKVSELRRPGEDSKANVTAERPTAAIRRVLWVDDVPVNNAFVVARLRQDGIDVVEATSTPEGVRLITGRPDAFAAIVTDMGRQEGRTYNVAAGLDFIRAVRVSGLRTPIFVYTSAVSADRVSSIRGAGGNGITDSPLELIELLYQVIMPAA